MSDFELTEATTVFELTDPEDPLFVLEAEVTVFELVEVGTPGPAGPGATLTSDPAEPLGVAAAGVSTEAARADHVHPMPDAADVGADPAGTAATEAGLVNTALTNHLTDTTDAHDGSAVSLATGTFDGNLDGTVTDVQLLAEAVDELVTGSPLSNDNPAALGTAAPGVGTEVSRDDHVHPMPDAQDIPALVAGAIAHGATAAMFGIGAQGPITIPTDVSFVYVIGAAGGTITLPPIASYGDGQVLTIVNNSGATLTVTASGGGGGIELSPGDSMPIGYPTLPPAGTILGFRAFAAANFWFADQISGSLVDLPYWPDGVADPLDSVVFDPLGGGLPTWYRLQAQDIPISTLSVNATQVEAAIDEVVVAARRPPIFTVPTVTTKVMQCDYQAGLPDANAGGWSTPHIADAPDGLDIRATIRFTLPTDTTLPLDDGFMEVITQLHDSAPADNFELAVQWTDDSYGGIAPGTPVLFYEAVLEGQTTEQTAGRVEMDLTPGEWAEVRLTHDAANDTVTFWRSVPYESAADCETIGGVIYYPVFSVTDPDFGPLDSGNTSDWYVGLRLTGEVASLYVEEYGSGTPLIDIQPASLDALTLGDTSFTDDAGNVWTTGAGQIANP